MSMNILALQAFLRNLTNPLAAVGVPPKSLDDLRDTANAFEPFRDLELPQLTDFLKRAAEYRRSGVVPAVMAPGIEDLTATSRKLTDAVQLLRTADDATAGKIEDVLSQGKGDLQAALKAVASSFGVTAKFTDEKKWLTGLRAQAATTRAVEAIRRLIPLVTEPASYQSEAVQSVIDRIAATDAKILKAAAVELGASGTSSGKKFVESILVKLTGIDNKLPKVPKKTKESEPTASNEQVEEMIRTLQDMVARAKDPSAVSDSEIDAILRRVSSEFSTEQQKSIAKQVTGQGGRSAQGAIDSLRADLTAVKRLLESQKV